jgi:hypothetical protein
MECETREFRLKIAECRLMKANFNRLNWLNRLNRRKRSEGKTASAKKD